MHRSIEDVDNSTNSKEDEHVNNSAKTKDTPLDSDKKSSASQVVREKSVESNNSSSGSAETKDKSCESSEGDKSSAEKSNELDTEERFLEVDKSGDKNLSDSVECEEGTSESDGNAGNGGNDTKDTLTNEPTPDSEGWSVQEVDVPKKKIDCTTLE